MDKYIVLLLTNNTDNEVQKCIHEMLQTATANTRTGWSTPPALNKTNRVHFCQLCLCTETEPEGQTETFWTDVTDDLTFASTSTAHSCPDQLIDQERTTALAEDLHKLASELPHYGAYVDVVWPVEVVKHLELNDHLMLFGALKRLVEWHNTHVHFLVTDGGQTGTASYQVQEWLDLLRGSQLPPSGMEEMQRSCLWRGSLVITGTQATNSLHLQGFCLSPWNFTRSGPKFQFKNPKEQQEQTKTVARVTSDTLELVAVVPFDQVPSFYVTHHAYALHVPSSTNHLSSSHEFLLKLKKDRTAAFILRLRYGSSWQNAFNAKSQKKKKDVDKTKDWKELIIDNIANLTDHKKPGELNGDVGSHLFLLHAGPPSLENGCIAFMMRKASDFDGAIASDIAQRELISAVCTPLEEPGEETVQRVEELLGSVPHLEAATLLDLQSHVERSQYTAIKHWIEKKEKKKTINGSTEIPVSTLMCLLRGTAEACRRSTQLEKYFRPRPSMRLTLRQPRPEYDQDPAGQLERIALRLRQTTPASGLANLHSNDSLGGLSPPVKGHVLMLDPSEFLRHFKEDGTAARTENDMAISKVQGSSRFSRYTTGEVCVAAWPECLQAKDHDVYYNTGDRAELEERMDRVKSRLLSLETCSMCSANQSRSPRTIRLTNSARQARSPPDIRPVDTAGTQQDAGVMGSEGKSVPKQQGRKRKVGSSDVKYETKCDVAVKKRQKEVRDTPQSSSDKSNVPAKGKDAERRSRSERHKRKLETVVVRCLENHGVTKGDSMFPACIKKLYTLTKCFVKDLKTSHNLRQEMERIAESHVQQVIEFEKRMKK